MPSELVIHGHFYQPPRENPWTGTIEKEPGARPFPNWNERIHQECYRANAFARVVQPDGRLKRIVNNYANISFNFGPTLLSWLERADPDAYQRILEADRQSVERRSGHGNAIAQGHNHSILPLCNARDRRTQILWGLSDFRHRFGREAEGFWLPETACNHATLDDLIDAGVSFTILSPYQAARVREIGSSKWKELDDGEVDPGIPYAYHHGDGSGRSLAIFFYDGPIARAFAFEGGLSSSQVLVDLLERARGGDGRLVNVATDGESYGHHSHFADRALAYGLETEAVARDFHITNYGEFLEKFPPRHEAQIKLGDAEGSSWSCVHGVGRWCRDCGCSTGGAQDWNQRWRGPLRQALDLLRDAAAEVFESDPLLRDPWAARDEYISIILDRGKRNAFLDRHVELRGGADRTRALTLFELQRHSLLMYTSCGWFFADISGIETLQILKYAARTLDFMEELGRPGPRDAFLELLSGASSNRAELGNGADIFRKQVESSRVSAKSLASHFALTSLVDAGVSHEGEAAGYDFSISELRREEHGRLTLATGRVKQECQATEYRLDTAFVALHFGGVDFYGITRPYPGAEAHAESVERIWSQHSAASLPRLLRLAQAEFGSDEFGLEHVLPEGREQIGKVVFGNVLNHFADEYARLYKEQRRTLELLRSAGFELPAELRAAGEFTLTRRLERELEQQEGSRDPESYARFIEISENARRAGYQIDTTVASRHFAELITESTRDLAASLSGDELETVLEFLRLVDRARIRVNLDRAQELIFEIQHDIPESSEKIELFRRLRMTPLGATAQEPADPATETDSLPAS